MFSVSTVNFDVMGSLLLEMQLGFMQLTTPSTKDGM
jgi:hypothetical protein